MLILIVSGVFLMFSSVISELETNYITTGISNASKINSSYTEGFDRTSTLNDTFKDVLPGFTDELGQGGTGEDSGTWSVFQGIVAIPKVIISLPRTIYEMGAIGVSLVFQLGRTLEIDDSFLTIAVIGVMLILIFGIIRLWRQYDA